MFNLVYETLEDILELDLPVDHQSLATVNYNWVRYNPRKNINRYGCSITSLTGLDSGIPDLDSILEYNQIFNTDFKEKDFNIRTKHAAPFSKMLDKFHVGRSHYIKLDRGGYFPWHRDSDINFFRIIYTISKCDINSLIWIIDDEVIKLQNDKWYFINTKKAHCLFSFNESIFAVFNVVHDYHNHKQLFEHFKIK